VRAAIAREKELKGWRREKKLRLIESMNPEWRDLAEDWLAFARGAVIPNPERSEGEGSPKP
jgi:hypothetical protein